MSDVYDSPLWEIFAKDSQMQARQQCTLDMMKTGLNIALVGSSDGANPFDKKNYSLTPMAWSCLNLPPWIRHRFGSTLISGIIPGESLPFKV